MKNKKRLEVLLAGGIPDMPPTWELVFQIQEPFFGMPARKAVRDKAYASEEARRDALWQYDFEVYERCVEELGWAAIPGCDTPEENAFRKKRIGDRALVVGYDWSGVFWMPSGDKMVDMLQDTNDTEIRKSVRYCMEHGGIGKPYIFSTSNCIFNGMPTESYRIMLDEYQRLIGG